MKPPSSSRSVRDGYCVLARYLERLSAGGDHPHVRRGAKDIGHELSGFAEKVFEVVDNQKHRFPLGIRRGSAIESSIQTIRAVGSQPQADRRELSNHRVDVTFVGAPPARKVPRRFGVTDVEVDGCRLHCQVWGSFQPFLEALHGSEVIRLTSHSVIVPMTPSNRRSVTS